MPESFALAALGSATALHTFLLVHRLVGLFEQLFEAGHALRFELRDADTESELDAALFRRVVGFEIVVEPLDGLVFVGVEIGDEHRKLVAAKPGDDV